jgi:L-erythro-3,5-diaminohexanoate dehydrogenase
LAADVTMLIGNCYLPGHAEHALSLLRTEPGVRRLFEARLDGSGSPRGARRAEPDSSQAD